MPQDDVEIIRELYGALAESDLDRIFASMHPEVGVDLSRRLLDPATFRGHEGGRDLLRQQRQVWSSERIEPEEYTAVGKGLVVVPTRFVATGRGSEINVSARATYVWELRDGLVVRVTMYQSQAEAFEAVGLPNSEWCQSAYSRSPMASRAASHDKWARTRTPLPPRTSRS